MFKQAKTVFSTFVDIVSTFATNRNSNIASRVTYMSLNNSHSVTLTMTCATALKNFG